MLAAASRVAEAKVPRDSHGEYPLCRVFGLAANVISGQYDHRPMWGAWTSGSKRPSRATEKLQLAKDLGADIVIDARTEDPAAVLQAHGGADVAIGLAVDGKSFATAYAGLRRGGRLVLVALPAAGTLSIPVFDTVLNGTSVIGSIVGTRADLLDVFALHAAGKTRVIYESRPLAAVNESIAEVLHGKAKARIVMTP
jgi:alcohol dehydrogenase, propanol-preferring